MFCFLSFYSALAGCFSRDAYGLRHLLWLSGIRSLGVGKPRCAPLPRGGGGGTDPCATGDLFSSTLAGGAAFDDMNIVISFLILFILDSMTEILVSMVAIVCASEMMLISSFCCCRGG